MKRKGKKALKEPTPYQWNPRRHENGSPICSPNRVNFFGKVWKDGSDDVSHHIQDLGQIWTLGLEHSDL
jgi:hypothetical protein